MQRAFLEVAVSMALALGCLGATIPSDVRIATSERELRFTSGDRVLSTATLCPGYVFDQFGVSGPLFSPDLHWVLVDVLGPFTPGNVARNHALIDVATGTVVPSSAFPADLGVPSSLDPVSWVSGERQTLHYQKGPDATIREPLRRPLPHPACAR